MKRNKKLPVKLPDWMHEYYSLLGNTGGNTPEELLTRLRDDDKISITNFPLFVLAVAVESWLTGTVECE